MSATPESVAPASPAEIAVTESQGPSAPLRLSLAGAPQVAERVGLRPNQVYRAALSLRDRQD